MFIARVVGDVISTHRHEHLGARKLLLIRRLALDGEEEGAEIIALDVIGVGDGERVLVVQEGGSARAVFDDPRIPVQAVIVGVVDQLHIER
jgi:ethanolamine utilization protein EutN